MGKYSTGVMFAFAICAPAVPAVEGTCAHNEMRAWVDAEEACYHRFGPLTERYRLQDSVNEGSLSSCLKAAQNQYFDRRLICELRGESAYRADGVHRLWSKYKLDYTKTVKRLQKGG